MGLLFDDPCLALPLLICGRGWFPPIYNPGKGGAGAFDDGGSCAKNSGGGGGGCVSAGGGGVGLIGYCGGKITFDCGNRGTGGLDIGLGGFGGSGGQNGPLGRGGLYGGGAPANWPFLSYGGQGACRVIWGPGISYPNKSLV